MHLVKQNRNLNEPIILQLLHILKNINKSPLKNKGVIVEFVGPPGAGKSTNCLHFSEFLTEKSFKVCTSKDIKDYVNSMNHYRKLILFARTLFSQGHTFFLFTIVLALNRIYSLNSIYRFIKLTTFNRALNNYLKDKNIDVILLDQWAIQELWSATIFKISSFEKIKSQLKRFYFQTDIILYFDINTETASKRIKNRNTNLSRFDKMSEKLRLVELEKYRPYLFELYQNAECEHKLILSTQIPPNINALTFHQKLISYYKKV